MNEKKSYSDTFAKTKNYYKKKLMFSYLKAEN